MNLLEKIESNEFECEAGNLRNCKDWQDLKDRVKTFKNLPLGRKISEKGLNLLKEFEGLRLEAYQCSAGIWTIGYGHTYKVKRGDIITKEKAELLLRNDLGFTENKIEELVKVPINQNQFDALVSLAFNIGVGAFNTSTLLRKLNTGDYEGAASEFPKWRKAKGIVVEGLVKRREKEQALFKEVDNGDNR